MTPSAAELTRELDPLPHPDRVTRLVALAHETAPPARRTLLADLHAGSAFGRELGLRLAVVGGDLDHLRACLADPVLRCSAAIALVRHGADLADVGIEHLPSAIRRKVYLAVRRYRDAATADALIAPVRARFGDAEAGRLLPSCSPELVAELLPDLAHAVPNWSALAAAHPHLVLDHLDRALEQTPKSNWGGLPGLRTGPAVAAPVAPKRVLDLAERTLGRVDVLGHLREHHGVLGAHDPDRLLRLLLDPRHGRVSVDPSTCRALRGATDLGSLVRVISLRKLPVLLHALAPARRHAVFQAGVHGVDDHHRHWPSTLAGLDLLPRAHRIAEARKLLLSPVVRDDPALRLAVTARTDWTEAAPALAAAAEARSVAERAQAYRLTIAAAAATGKAEILGTVLTVLPRVPIDPEVHLTVLVGLLTVPAALFRDEDTELLRDFATNVLGVDRPAPTAVAELCRLALRLIDAGVHEGRERLADCGRSILRAATTAPLPMPWSVLTSDLPPGAETALLPRANAEVKQGRYDTALFLADLLGERAWSLPELQDAVDSGRRSPVDGIALRALGLWLADPATRGQRVARALTEDVSTILVPSVAAAVAALRTDLLDKLPHSQVSGRFVFGGEPRPPRYPDRWFHRWLPRQRERYARSLAAVAGDHSVPVDVRLDAARALRSVPVLRELVPLPGLADTGQSQVWINPSTRPAPGQVAIRALIRCAPHLPPDELGAALGPLWTSTDASVVVRVVALAAAHRIPALPDRLAECSRLPGQDAAVRRAVVTAAVTLLDTPVVWDLLAEAAADPAVAPAIPAAAPESVPARHRARYAGLVRSIPPNGADSWGPYF
ncbi:hypothetical protein [Actinokineospora enzanensis]|uniref:hypothetical protein n=1 Tax=Actinokineospora enzanensis TaxID=155975 RepID=UPI00037FB20C|nr:hypothetical protein [Actinokineospora enzanensis]